MKRLAGVLVCFGLDLRQRKQLWSSAMSTSVRKPRPTAMYSKSSGLGLNSNWRDLTRQTVFTMLPHRTARKAGFGRAISRLPLLAAHRQLLPHLPRVHRVRQETCFLS